MSFTLPYYFISIKIAVLLFCFVTTFFWKSLCISSLTKLIKVGLHLRSAK